MSKLRSVGLTPEVTPDQAVSLAHSDLEIRCPRCGSIVSIESGLPALLAGLEAPLTGLQDEARRVVLDALQVFRDRKRQDEHVDSK